MRSVFVGSGVYPLLLHVGLGALRHQIVSDRRREEDRGGRTYDHADDQSVWFEKIRTLGSALGYAAKPKDYKKHPEDYKGHVGDVSTVIRLAVTGRTQSPDVWEIQQILGEERTISRIKSYAAR